MPRTWKTEQEQELIRLVKDGVSIEALAEKYRRSPQAITKKIVRLGLDVAAAKAELTGQLKMPKELPSLEEVLKIVAAAIYKACQGGLGKTELQRLDTIATLFKAYRDGLEQYVNYRKIEAELVNLREKYERLAKEKAKGNASK